jgi:hypothetical protein
MINVWQIASFDSSFDMIDENAIRIRYANIGGMLDERRTRLFAASEARALGHGGVSAVSRATGIARSTIRRGLDELDEGPENIPGSVRRPGGGRKELAEKDPSVLDDLKAILEPATMGDPMRPLLWISKSFEKLASALQQIGHTVGRTAVGRLIGQLGYSRQQNRKTLDGGNHPDRDAQFEHINATAQTFMEAGQPVLSVDTKKKELVGQYKNPGSDYRPKGSPDAVNVHDFVDEELGKAIPYGLYDVGGNMGWVSVGINNDTSEFAVNAIRRWYAVMGRERYPNATRLFVTADGGGSNGSRVRLWKRELQRLADELGIEIVVCHYPPGTSKWNKVEHRLFCPITQNWRGKPLVDRMTVVELIGATTTKAGLTVRCELDENVYEKGIKVSNAEMNELNIVRNSFHPEWNYTILPRTKGQAN